MRRRRSSPWIHRWSRPITAGIATLGAIETAFLTVVEVMGSAEAVCPTSGCKEVLGSPYATVFGLPLTLFGFFGYAGMLMLAIAPLLINPDQNKELRTTLDQWTRFLMFVTSTVMVVGSAYLMYIMAFTIGAFCPYCVLSAFLSLSLFVVTLIGHAWEDIGQLAFTGLTVAMVTLVATLGVYGNVNNPQATPGTPPPVTTTSGPAEVALVEHLNDMGAKYYGAYWCPHCHEQKELFGQEAASNIDYVECAADGVNAQVEQCKAAGVQAFPSWEINGQLYAGVRSLNELADLSDYQGPRDFGQQ
ncbi:vitamin K epoxide reductase family protein [Roseofilum capinflatum]|uniref:Vitamin K epoxide reductase family protein n=1 Tax=Roseofilum capinflatum BLCC-M114 TaxID=3022440 RepID=A0ABT7B737_9CYAN|nr:vitamin K epoxide reductase family protein [Roseofilum capinflatum]MDJ1174920.1 vitamin K epoxide reductase family protein [Roseofilum capinflatum BLCC-M114]